MTQVKAKQESSVVEESTVNKTQAIAADLHKVIVLIQSKQYLVNVGSYIDCQKFDNEVDTELSFETVLCSLKDGTSTFGKPFLNHKVTARVVSHTRDAKVIIFKKLRRHGYQRKRGHRQPYTTLQITKIA